MADQCPDCGGQMPVPLTFDPDRYRRVAELVTACAYGDEERVHSILDETDRDLAAAMLVMFFSAVVSIAELADSTVEAQLQGMGIAAAQAAEAEK